MPGGRPSKYQDEFAAQAVKLCNLGATDKDLADFFEVSTRTIMRWAAENVEFCQALKVGKTPADDRVERSLYHRANGYSYQAVKIFQYEGEPVKVPYVEHVPPDTTACIFWLKNRRPEAWRDAKEVNGTFTHESAGISALADFVERAIGRRTETVIEADVSERSLLPALLHAQAPGSGK